MLNSAWLICWCYSHFANPTVIINEFGRHQDKHLFDTKLNEAIKRTQKAMISHLPSWKSLTTSVILQERPHWPWTIMERISLMHPGNSLKPFTQHLTTVIRHQCIARRKWNDLKWRTSLKFIKMLCFNGFVDPLNFTFVSLMETGHADILNSTNPLAFLNL